MTPIENLDSIQQRVHWLATRIIDHANRERPSADGLKVGGHQASSASMVSIMTALWFDHLRGDDRVAVKPHASPILHAIEYLFGNLDQYDLTTLRSFGGLQAYPSITKDKFEVDFSTGSVGLGAVAPLMAGVTRRYVDAHFGARPHSRFVSLIGDAELDEGNIWEAISDPVTAELGNVLWIIDLNRQSLDRVVPGIKAERLKMTFVDQGWHVLEAKYGRRLQAACDRADGDLLRAWIDEMPNERYQASLSLSGAELRAFFFEGASQDVRRTVTHLDDADLAGTLHNLGGHDLDVLLEIFRAADAETTKPTVVFAYTIKGWGLPIAGDPANHSALLSEAQIETLRAQQRLTTEDEWARFDPHSAEGAIVARSVERMARPAPSAPEHLDVPTSVARSTAQTTSTQISFGRLVSQLGRNPEVAPLLVTTAPDVAVSTGLGGWINQVGVFHHREQPEYASDGVLRWRQHPAGQHLELGISEMNLFSLLGALGMSSAHHGQRLLPVGALYDPFVCRGLDAFIHAVYQKSKFIVAGTPSGVTLSPEGGAHQSSITASIGLELPNVTFAEPAYVGALDWLLCDGLDRIANVVDAEAMYLRLTTRQLDQTPFENARQRLGDELLRTQVLEGGYVLTEGGDPAGASLVLAACGAVMPEVLQSAEDLIAEGVAVRVVDVTSVDRLYRAWKQSLSEGIVAARRGGAHPLAGLLNGWDGPIVTVHDAASHAMAWLGAATGRHVVPIGVDKFGESGTIADLYDAHGLSAGMITNAALLGLAAFDAT